MIGIVAIFVVVALIGIMMLTNRIISDDSKVEMWCARNKNGDLNLFYEKPIRSSTWGDYLDYWRSEDFDVGYPTNGFDTDVTWDNSPKKVIINLKG